MLTDSDNVRERWKEYIEDLYDKKTVLCQPLHKDDHACLLDELAAVTVDEVTKVIRSLPAKSSSPVNFMPTSLLKSTVHVMAPLITRLANMSFSVGVFPSSLKQGHVTPLLKKSGLDQFDMANYRPDHQLEHDVQDT